MAQTTVSDVVIWSKHVRGEDLAERLVALRGGETVSLIVDGVRGSWCKMRDGKDGRPTPGIRPVGNAQKFWQDLFQSRKGETVTIALPDDDGHKGQGLFPAMAKSEDEREAALHALLNHPGWPVQGPDMTRDEMNAR